MSPESRRLRDARESSFEHDTTTRLPVVVDRHRERVFALLRRVADTPELLGDVQIYDITFHAEPTDGDVPSPSPAGFDCEK